MAEKVQRKRRLKVAWMTGDGVGVDVMEAARQVVEAVGLNLDRVPADVGWAFWTTEGSALPDRTLALLREVDCALMGPILSKPREEAEHDLAPHLAGTGLVYQSPLVRLRHEFGLGVRIRPCRACPGNPRNFKDDVDVTVFEDNQEGLLCGVEFHPLPADLKRALMRRSPNFARFGDVEADELAMSTRLATKRGCDALVERAFAYARRMGHERVTLADKPTVMRETAAMLLRSALGAAERYPDVRLEQMDVDALCMLLLRKPEHYRVVVAPSVFGSIVGDLCTQLAGGLGMGCAGAVGEKLAVFSPLHGPGPRHAGKGQVNPLGTLLALASLLEWVGWQEDATGLRDAVADVVRAGSARTWDLGGTSTTTEVAQAVAGAWRRRRGEEEQGQGQSQSQEAAAAAAAGAAAGAGAVEEEVPFDAFSGGDFDLGSS